MRTKFHLLSGLSLHDVHAWDAPVSERFQSLRLKHLPLPLLYPAINQLGLIFFTICGKGLPCLLCYYSEMQTLISFVFYGLVWAECNMSPYRLL